MLDIIQDFVTFLLADLDSQVTDSPGNNIKIPMHMSNRIIHQQRFSYQNSEMKWTLITLILSREKQHYADISQFMIFNNLLYYLHSFTKYLFVVVHGKNDMIGIQIQYFGMRDSLNTHLKAKNPQHGIVNCLPSIHI